MSFEQNKSILFVLGRFTVGGVERVTITMANAFVANGWHVCIVVFQFVDKNLLSNLNTDVAVEELGMPAFRVRKISALRDIMRRNKTSHVINQWALPFPLTFMLRLALPKGAKLIAFHHTVPDCNGRLQRARGIKRFVIAEISKWSMRIVYRFSDAYVVLSPSLMSVFRQFTGLRQTTKLTWLPNPLIKSSGTKVEKENIILYVGRLSLLDKRVDRVLAVWKRLSPNLPGWRLEIVGDGPDRKNLEAIAQGLQRVVFHGFQDATPYFQKGKVLLLTSDFEGFGMVLIEAMSEGCVPVAYGSFPTVHDIIHGDDGIVVAPPWDEKDFCDQVQQLIQDEKKWSDMSARGRTHVRDFDLDKVFRMYVDLLGRL